MNGENQSRTRPKNLETLNKEELDRRIKSVMHNVDLGEKERL